MYPTEIIPQLDKVSVTVALIVNVPFPLAMVQLLLLLPPLLSTEIKRKPQNQMAINNSIRDNKSNLQIVNMKIGIN